MTVSNECCACAAFPIFHSIHPHLERLFDCFSYICHPSSLFLFDNRRTCSGLLSKAPDSGSKGASGLLLRRGISDGRRGRWGRKRVSLWSDGVLSYVDDSSSASALVSSSASSASSRNALLNRTKAKRLVRHECLLVIHECGRGGLAVVPFMPCLMTTFHRFLRFTAPPVPCALCPLCSSS